MVKRIYAYTHIYLNVIETEEQRQNIPDPPQQDHSHCLFRLPPVLCKVSPHSTQFRLDPAERPPRGSALKHGNLELGRFARLALWDKHSVFSVRHTCGTKEHLREQELKN